MNLGIRSILSVFQFAQKQGVAPAKLSQVSGVDLLGLEQGKMPDIAQVNSLWTNAIALTGDKHLGLHIGEDANLTALGIVWELIQNSPTVEAALNHTIQYLNLITESFSISMEKGKSHFSLYFHPNEECLLEYPQAIHQIIDSALVFSLTECRALLLEEPRPLHLHIARPQPDDPGEYQRIFKCPVLFEQPVTSLQFNISLLAKPIIAADYQLLQLLSRYAEEKQEALGKSQRFADIVKNIVISQSTMTVPRIHEVAAMLNMGVRSFQRKLKAEDITYQEILDQVRKDFALRYIKAGQHPIKEISYLLGYNEVSAFTRSFRRWTGMSPIQYREAGTGMGNAGQIR